MTESIYFVSGIDTDCGKTIATGLIAGYLMKEGKKVVTQKLVQTGCEGVSEDIITHRSLMKVALFPEDEKGRTCPYVFKLPASPHLAAEKENKSINCAIIDFATAELRDTYDVVLLEGAGGLFVPINRDYSIMEFVAERKYPLILVTSAKVGSINHTIMSLEMIKAVGIKLQALVYNHHPESEPLIIADSRLIFSEYLKEHFPGVPVYDIPFSEDMQFENLDFNEIIG